MFVKIKKGSYRNVDVVDKIFPLIKEFTFKAANDGSGNVTVDGTPHPGFPSKKIRITVFKHADAVICDKDGTEVVCIKKKVAKETDKEIIARIDKRIDLMRKMTRGAKDGRIRSFIITGPAGVGKSFGVFEELEDISSKEVYQEMDPDEFEDEIEIDPALIDPDAEPIDRIPSGPRYDIVKGITSAIGLYAKLWEYRHPGDVLVFDDCDDALEESDQLNLLKAALDSGKKRTLQYHKDSRFLGKLGIENKFEFEGSIIFITNIDMHGESTKDSGSAKKKAHLRALMSRSHYLDLAMRTEREMMLRIKSVFETGALFKKYDFTQAQEEEIINYISDNKEKLREISLRMAVNIADLVSLSKDDPAAETTWQEDAEVLCQV